MNKTIDWSNKDEVLYQASQNGYTSLRKASKELKKDMDIIKAAILNNSSAFTKIDAEFLPILKQNKPFFLDVLKKNGLILEYASNELKGDIDIVSTAISQNGMALKHASDELQNNKDIVLNAVKQSGMVLEYAPLLQNDKDIVLQAVKQNGFAIQFASDDLKENKEIVIEALKQDSRSSIWIPKKCCENDTVKIFNLHGNINFIDESEVQFDIPPNTSIITITAIGQMCPLVYDFKKNFTTFYKENNTIFQNNDTSKLKTREGQIFQEELNSSEWTHPNITYKFKNHLEGEKMNNFNYDWNGPGCDYNGNQVCSMDCLMFDKNNEFIDSKEDCVHNIRSKSGILQQNFTLKDLVDHNGTGVYIVLSCRYLDETNTYGQNVINKFKEGSLVQRELSNTSNSLMLGSGKKKDKTKSKRRTKRHSKKRKTKRHSKKRNKRNKINKRK